MLPDFRKFEALHCMEKEDGGINSENLNTGSEEQVLDLKKVRESKGLTLQEISRATRISHAILGVIETEKFGSLPEPIYTTAFIRKYAEALGVDSEEILYRYSRYLKKQEISGNQKGVLKKKSWIKSNHYLFIWGAFTIAIVFFFVFYFFHQDYMEKRVAVKKHVAEEIYEDLLLKESESVKGEEHAGQAVQESQIPPDVVKKEEAAVRQAPDNRAQEKTESETPVTDAGAYKLTINAKELTWLKIAQDDAGSFEIMLQPGEKLERKAKEKFFVIVGNAGGVDVIFDGKSLGALGAHGDVVYLNLP